MISATASSTSPACSIWNQQLRTSSSGGSPPAGHEAFTEVGLQRLICVVAVARLHVQPSTGDGDPLDVAATRHVQ